MLARAELTHRADFSSKNGNGVPEKIAALAMRKLVELADEFQIKVGKPVEDEEHHTWSLCFTDAQGATRCDRLDAGFQPRVPPDDGEVLAHQGVS